MIVRNIVFSIVYRFNNYQIFLLMRIHFCILIFALLLDIASVKAQNVKVFTQKEAYELIDRITPSAFERTNHSDAQWFPEAGFGLFIHWGIHSVACLDPSWSMLKNCPWLVNAQTTSPERYYKLAAQFNPVNYDPEKWILAAKNAGFQYIVLTAKHHDGYCLWPSQYGRWNTGEFMGGRDLLKPFIEACRRYGLKVGLYFSPRDWGNPEYAFPYKDYDYNKKAKEAVFPKEEDQARFDAFFRTTIGQLSELLTNYGEIDILWFDGIDWPDVDTYPEILHAWIREIQPGMVINPRWETNEGNKPFGDFRTEEISWRKHMEEGRPYEPGVWWEFNETWSGHWGYSPLSPFRDFQDIVRALVYARSYGGNYLPDIGPLPDGRMRPGFYDECLKLSAWMEKNKASVIGTSDFDDWKEISNVPLTRSEECIYAHLLNDFEGQVHIENIDKPCSIVLLENGEEIQSYRYKNGKLSITVPDGCRGYIDDVLRIIFLGKE
jgi:alpha-L-fucosidase